MSATVNRHSLALWVVAFVLLISMAGCDNQPERPRKQQVVKLLPDTPPPPPPPPKPEDRPPPKPEDKLQDAPKPVDASTPQALKTDEAPGAGPGSGLTSGAVTQEYTDQKIGPGTTIGGTSIDTTTNRLAANSYANAMTRALNEYLARDREVRRLDYKVQVEVWLSPAGTLQRAELLSSTGDAQTDEALRSALARYPGTGTPLPAQMPQPVRLQVSNRLLG